MAIFTPHDPYFVELRHDIERAWVEADRRDAMKARPARSHAPVLKTKEALRTRLHRAWLVLRSWCE